MWYVDGDSDPTGTGAKDMFVLQYRSSQLAVKELKAVPVRPEEIRIYSSYDTVMQGRNVMALRTHKVI